MPATAKKKPPKPDIVEEFASGGQEPRRAARGLLKAEHKARRQLATLVTTTVALLVDDLQKLEGNPEAEVQTQLVVKRSADQFQRAAQAVLEAAMARARTAAATGLAQHMDTLFRVMQRFGAPVSRDSLRGNPAETAGDMGRAEAVAKSLASAWHLLNSILGGKTPSESIVTARDAGQRLQKRATRAAVTETSVAYNTETEAELDEIEERARAKHLPLRELLYKRWESMLDRRVCPICANHDNEVVKVGEPFRNDDKPGLVHPHCHCLAVPAAHEADLNIAAAVTRELTGPGLGRRALGEKGRSVYDAPESLPEEQRRKWLEMYERAKTDEDYRADLLQHEVRRHMESTEAGEERHAAVVPRIRPDNTRARGIHTDQRAPRAVHEEALGRQVGLPYGHIVRGEIVGSKTPSYQDWRRSRGWRAGPDPLTETRKKRGPKGGGGGAPGVVQPLPASRTPAPRRGPRGTPEAARPQDLPTIGKDASIREFVSVLSEEETNHVLLGFRDAGLVGWLEKHPLQRLQLLGSVRDQGRRVLGKYHPLEAAIGVDVSGDLAVLGEPFVWGTSFSISRSADSLLGCSRRILVHELGHHVWTSLSPTTQDRFVTLMRTSSMPSRRARANEREFFAEAFSAFVYHRNELASGAPELYTLTQDVFEELQGDVS